jgi:hypothetical protein
VAVAAVAMHCAHMEGSMAGRAVYK